MYTLSSQVFKVSCQLTLKVELSQTDPAIHRKRQTVKLSDCYHRIHTLPIPTSNGATPMDNVGIPFKTTMTPVYECNDDAPIIDSQEVKHSQTLKVVAVNKKSGPYRSYVASLQTM